MPPTRAELAAKHARLLELAATGCTTQEIARELHMDRRSVRQIRNDAGLPADLKPERQPLTLEQKWATFTRSVDGAHLEWTGSRVTNPARTPILRYRGRVYSAAGVAFKIRTGRDAVGQAFAECGQHQCVAPEHVDDTTTRVRDRDALRIVLGMPLAPAVCSHGHGQAVNGRREPDGTAYCAACKQEQRAARFTAAGTSRPGDQ